MIPKSFFPFPDLHTLVAATNSVFGAVITLLGYAALGESVQSVGHDYHDVLIATVFGATLAFFVTVRFYWYVSLTSQWTHVGLCLTARHLTRIVYLTLYCLTGKAALLSCWTHQSLALYAVQLHSYLDAGILVLLLINLLAHLLSPKAVLDSPLRT